MHLMTFPPGKMQFSRVVNVIPVLDGCTPLLRICELALYIFVNLPCTWRLKMVPKHVGSERCAFYDILRKHVFFEKVLILETNVFSICIVHSAFSILRLCVAKCMMAQHAPATF